MSRQRIEISKPTMINVSGEANRSFIFPASLSASFAYLTDLDHILDFLPHISIVRAYGGKRYRMRYRSIELGLYEVSVFCDIETRIDPQEHTLHLQPWKNSFENVKDQAGLYSLSGHGRYTSQSIFHSWREYTQIEFRLQLEASLPVPLALSLVPRRLLNTIAGNIVERRTREISASFIDRSVHAFQTTYP